MLFFDIVKLLCGGLMKKVLITGATSGLGLEFARYYGDRGYHLHLLGRNNEKLLELKDKYSPQCEVNLWNVDLSKDNQLDHFLNQIKDESFEIVINNAGLGDYGPFVSSDQNKVEQMVRVNVLALTKIAHVTLQNMVKRNKGYLLNVASMAGFMSGPNMAVYYATKSYVIHFSEALTAELKNDNVVVSCLCPGPVDTQFYSRSNLENSNLFKNLWVADAPTVVMEGIFGLQKKKPVNIVGFQNQMIVFATRFIPRQLLTNLTQYAQKHRKN